THEDSPTPSREDVVSRIAAENNLDENSIEVEGIYTGFGKNTSRAELKITEEFEYEEELEEETVEEETEVEEPETDTEEEETEAETAEADYEEIVSGTISDAKDQLQELENPDWDAALEAEKDNKDRKTFKEWLENRE
ncbi:MAG: hypothetical protein ABEJ62_01140, partial [Candidatus Nanohaloarchaea archaeon]